MRHVPGNLYVYDPPAKNRHAVHMSSYRPGLTSVIYPRDVLVFLRWEDIPHIKEPYAVFLRCNDQKIVKSQFPAHGYVQLIAKAP